MRLMKKSLQLWVKDDNVFIIDHGVSLAVFPNLEKQKGSLESAEVSLCSSLSVIGLEILAFPCNQFGAQEPGTNEQILDFACTRFKAEYPIFDKVDVNGGNAAPIYKFLKSRKGSLFGSGIKWNFTKFLVDKEGHVVDRYAPTTSPLSFEKKIKKLLGLV